MLDKLYEGDVLGMIDEWGQVFSFAWDNFTSAFSPTAPTATEAIAETGGIEAALTIPEFSSSLGLLALIWFVFVILTHTTLWKRLTSWQMPTAISLAIGIPLLLFAGSSAIAFAAGLPASVWAGGAMMTLIVLAALPVLAGLGLVLERMATLIHR